MNEHTHNSQFRSIYTKSFLAKVDAGRREREKHRKMQEAREKIKSPVQKIKEEQKIALDRQKAQLAAVSRYRVIDIITPDGHVIPERRKTVETIIYEVAAETGISASEIKGIQRAKAIVAARHEAIKRALEQRADLSLPQIGKAFNRDHTTILHVRDKYGLQRTNTYHKNKQAA